MISRRVGAFVVNVYTEEGRAMCNVNTSLQDSICFYPRDLEDLAYVIKWMKEEVRKLERGVK